MHQRHSSAYLTEQQRFNDRFPTAIVAILAVIQMLTTFAIIAFEIGHILISIRLTNLFAGLWTSLPFTILWISMFATVCCCRRRNCATHAVVQNLISLVFASALIGINIAFLRRPNTCFFSDNICESLSLNPDISLPFSCSADGFLGGCQNTRLALIKAQLAAGAIMATTCLVYLIVYCCVASQASRTSRHQVTTIVENVMAPVYPQTLSYQRQPYTIPAHHSIQPSAPVLMPAHHHQVPPQNSNSISYLPPNYHPTLYPQIPNDRF